MLYIKYSRDKVKLYKVVKTDNGFKSVPNDAISLLNTLTSSKLELNRTKEESNMCEAIEGLIEDGRKEGERKGEVKTLISLVKDKILSLQQAAARPGMMVENFEKEARNLALY